MTLLSAAVADDQLLIELPRVVGHRVFRVVVKFIDPVLFQWVVAKHTERQVLRVDQALYVGI